MLVILKNQLIENWNHKRNFLALSSFRRTKLRATKKFVSSSVARRFRPRRYRAGSGLLEMPGAQNGSCIACVSRWPCGNREQDLLGLTVSLSICPSIYLSICQRMPARGWTVFPRIVSLVAGRLRGAAQLPHLAVGEGEERYFFSCCVAVTVIRRVFSRLIGL